MLTNRQEIAFFSTLGLILFVFLIITYIYGHPERFTEPGKIAESTPRPIESVEITAKSAYVYDTATGRVLYAKNEDERLPLASVTKVMAALVASELAPENAVVTITRDAVRTDGDSGLRSGERWALRDLLDLTLTSSANDGARAVALALGALGSSDQSSDAVVNDFVERMNLKAAELGMMNTYYFNDTGLDESQVKGGAYGSAKDQALLLEYILREKPLLLAATREPSFSIVSLDGLTHAVQNTNLNIDEIPGIVASKTGYTDLAGGNLVIAFDPEIGRPIIISVLGSTTEGRFSDVLALTQASLESIANSVILEE
jgi:serine-type D-Ala-D-Ala carboxypeptidase (penicillin-binding protein 5/6)